MPRDLVSKGLDILKYPVQPWNLPQGLRQQFIDFLGQSRILQQPSQGAIRSPRLPDQPLHIAKHAVDLFKGLIKVSGNRPETPAHARPLGFIPS